MGYFSDLNVHADYYGSRSARDKIISDLMAKGSTRREAEAYAETQISLASVESEEFERRMWERR